MACQRISGTESEKPKKTNLKSDILIQLGDDASGTILPRF
jgi:hypothetical protein